MTIHACSEMRADHTLYLHDQAQDGLPWAIKALHKLRDVMSLSISKQKLEKAEKLVAHASIVMLDHRQRSFAVGVTINCPKTADYVNC